MSRSRTRTLHRMVVSTIAGLVLAAPAVAQVQRDTVRLEDIVITATNVPVARDAVAASVTVLTNADLRGRGVTYVMDALRDQTGAAIVQGGGSFGSTASLFLRGGESDYVKILVDGVPLNGPGGAFDLAHLTTDNVDRIEIVRGPTSVLYGSDAMSGVVQIFTRRGRGAPSGEASFGAGTYGSTRWAGGLTGGSDRASYSFSVSRFNSDGPYAFNSQYHNLVAGGLIRVAPDQQSDATLSIRYSDHAFHFPTDGAGRLDDRNQFTYEDGTMLGLDVGRFFTSKVEARAHLFSNESDGGFDDQSDDPADTLGFYATKSLDHVRTRGGDVRANLHLKPGTILTAGAELRSETDRGFSDSRSEFGNSSSTLDLRRVNRAYFTQLLTDVAGRLAVNLGGRVDDNDAFGTFGTYRLGAALRLPAGTRIRASIGSAFKEPTFFENYSTDFSIGNPDLRPERSRSWEAGVEQLLAGGKVLASATWFDQRFRDLIQYTFTPVTPGGPNYFNIAGANASGLEAEMRLALPRGFEVRVNHTYVRSKVTDAGFDTGPDANFVTGERLLRRPTHATAGALVYRSGSGGASLIVNRVGSRDDRDFAGFPAQRVVLTGYTDVTAAVDYTIIPGRPGIPGFALTARIENLLDRDYQEIANFPARGRTIMAGGRIRIQ